MQDFSEWARFELFSRTELPNRVRLLVEALIGGINHHLLTQISELVRRAQDEVMSDYLDRYPNSRIPRPKEHNSLSVDPVPVLIDSASSPQLPFNTAFPDLVASTLGDPFFEDYSVAAHGMSYSNSVLGSESLGAQSNQARPGALFELFENSDYGKNLQPKQVNQALQDVDTLLSCPESLADFDKMNDWNLAMDCNL
jgi:hypothetical protein